jgi:hypothetical protein
MAVPDPAMQDKAIVVTGGSEMPPRYYFFS